MRLPFAISRRTFPSIHNVSDTKIMQTFNGSHLLRYFVFFLCSVMTSFSSRKNKYWESKTDSFCFLFDCIEHSDLSCPRVLIIAQNSHKLRFYDFFESNRLLLQTYATCINRSEHRLRHGWNCLHSNLFYDRKMKRIHSFWCVNFPSIHSVNHLHSKQFKSLQCSSTKFIFIPDFKAMNHK